MSNGGRRISFINVAMVILALGAVGAGLGILFGPRDTEQATGGDQTTSTETTAAPIDSLDGAQVVADAFAAGLTSGDLTDVAFAGTNGGLATAALDATTAGLAPFEVQATAGPVARNDRGLVVAPLDLVWTFSLEREWALSTEVELQPDDAGGGWAAVWSPSALEPSLRPGDTLGRNRIAPQRADIMGRDGSVLVTEVDLVDIGVQPSRVEDLPTLAAELQLLVGIDPEDLIARVNAANPDAFVDVTTLPRASYDAIRDDIFPLPGTVFRERNQPEAFDATFARALLGRSAEVTAEQIEEFPELFEPGDIVGRSGLQADYNAVLAGVPGIQIVVDRSAGEEVEVTTTTGTGPTTTAALRNPFLPDVVATVPAVDGEPLITTIDPGFQQAAENALDATELTSAMVVIEVSTGEIVALANGPRGASVNFAMTGRYPPGSIFKVVSGYALLSSGLGAQSPVDCPLTVTVGGRTFSNAAGEVLGTVPFRTIFSLSCNTGFINASTGFAPDTLQVAGLAFGLGDDAEVGTEAYLGNVPLTEDNVSLAATSFGQGETLVSPLAAAVMASSAADGVYRSPRIVTSPTPGPQNTFDLNPAAASTLRDLMREVVTDGTGGAVRNVAGGPVSGKTGTAEFGIEVPPRSHAWFVGFQGNLAFAVFVEGGEFGGSTAAPIAASFLNQVAAIDPAPAPAPDDTDGTESTTTTAAGETTTTAVESETTTSNP
ncbi:MAG: penicillin-binding transpeptidase domain-containing protein [Actinomycetota bacterium]